MKKHAIIPIFIPHMGCPNNCVFCNQREITARQTPIYPKDVEARILEYLPTLTGRGLTLEVAFYGGSFTGIPLEEQEAYLAVAKRYKDQGKIHKIHLSTRPDYIDEERLALLKRYQVDVIELGVQSFDTHVLALSKRGHDRDVVFSSAKQIKALGFELGIQLMIGLPGDSYEACMRSARETVSLAPALARIYPTVILPKTELFTRYRIGEYTPFSEEETLRTAKDMYSLLQQAGITILRVGLKSTDLINNQRESIGNTYHPAFRQLVEGELAKEALEKQLLRKISMGEDGEKIGEVLFSSNGTSFSNMIGNKKRNKLYFEKTYPKFRFFFKREDSLKTGEYRVFLK